MISLEWNDDIYREVLLEEGREEGIEIGEARGEARAMLDTARRMKLEKESYDKITRYTGLSEEEIVKL